jgi:glycine betaine catabolism A
MPGVQTLPGRDYHASDVFELERERVFARSWFYAGRVEVLQQPGDFITVDVAGESVLVVRTREGEIRAFYNVCRHRGSRLCDDESGRMKGAVKCPYHAWSYSFDGRLIGTPNVARDELDRDSLGLWPVAHAVWQGFLFVHLDPDPVPLEDWLRDNQEDEPLKMARFNLDELRIGHRTVTEVDANWKVLIDNYNECLHCPTVHPELVAVVPTFRSGHSYDTSRSDGGVALANDGNSFSATGHSRLPVTPGLSEAEDSLFGCTVYPNMFIDVTGTSAISTILLPRDPGHTTVITEYLFQPDVIASDGFDPSEIVDFVELVAHQDYVVCERVQRGIRSRAFDHGVLAEKDDLIQKFNSWYLARRGPVG